MSRASLNRSVHFAGYEFGGVDGGPTLDLANVTHEFVRGDETSPQDLAGAQKAARHADSLAKAAAESEREYQTARWAGSNWSDLLQEEQSDRRQLVEILQERRAVKGKGNYPALCSAIESTVKGILRRIKKSRVKRADLVNGDSPDLYFYTGETRLQEAFCEGAGLEVFPC